MFRYQIQVQELVDGLADQRERETSNKTGIPGGH